MTERCPECGPLSKHVESGHGINCSRHPNQRAAAELAKLREAAEAVVEESKTHLRYGWPALADALEALRAALATPEEET